MAKRLVFHDFSLFLFPLVKNRTYMKTNEEYGAYEAPQVEVIEVEVEQGFQFSTMPNGGDPF